MITGRIDTPAGLALFLGLDGENITRLVAGEPIRVPADRMKMMGLPAMAVVIHYRKTLAELQEDAATLAMQEAGQ
jgi:hypothetical protein